MKRLSQILAIAAVAISISGCKGTREMVREVPVYLHDTVHKQSVQKDSIYVHDSVYMYSVGDTLYLSKVHTKYIEREVHDTIREVQEIPVEVVRSEVVEVEKPLSRWQKMQIKGFWWSLTLNVFLLLWLTRKWWIKLIVG